MARFEIVLKLGECGAEVKVRTEERRTPQLFNP